MSSPTSIPNPTRHPARFSGAIVDKLRALILAEYPHQDGRPFIFDPFAGTGERLAELGSFDADGNRIFVGGIELQRHFIVNKRLVKQGDATKPKMYPVGTKFVIATSPVYPNGMAEQYDIGEEDPSYRPLYVVANKLAGGDVKLHPNNMGQFGYRGTRRGGRSVKRAAYWELAGQAVEQWTRNLWCQGIYLNVSDFMSGGVVEPLVDDWKALLRAHGWKIKRTVKVKTPRNKGVNNAALRVEHECIVVAVPGPNLMRAA
jgi:hypothetical protein